MNCPDPIDFHAFTTVDIYHDGNAFVSAGPWRTTPRPAERDYFGRTRVTMEQSNQKEAVLGSKSRSGGQWDIWEAVFSPVGADGYPKRIFDKRTGVIDTTVAAYWRDNYDLVHIMQRDWATLGPEAAREDHAQRRPLRQLLPERRRVPGGRLPQEHEEPAGGCDRRLRRARRALLERRPREPEPRVATHVRQPRSSSSRRRTG